MLYSNANVFLFILESIFNIDYNLITWRYLRLANFIIITSLYSLVLLKYRKTRLD